jgi:kynurenine formamidase
MAELGNRSRWGEDDQQGAMNLVTRDVTLKALKGVETGRMYDLSHDLRAGHPMMAPAQSPFVMSMMATADGVRRMTGLMGAKNDIGAFTERVELCMHTGTHIDALGHITIGEEMFNGFHYREHTSSFGLERLGIEQMPPLITRGVCLDMSGLDGGELLEGGRVITRHELERALEDAGVELQPGDALLYRTGWGRHFMQDNDLYVRTEPGIDVEAAAWLTSREVCAIGSDNMAVEVMPNPDPQLFLPVHQHALVEAGVHLIENLVLDGLARDAVTTFCLILLPVKFAGATASPVRPVALV